MHLVLPLPPSFLLLHTVKSARPPEERTHARTHARVYTCTLTHAQGGGTKQAGFFACNVRMCARARVPMWVRAVKQQLMHYAPCLLPPSHARTPDFSMQKLHLLLQFAIITYLCNSTDEESLYFYILPDYQW